MSKRLTQESRVVMYMKEHGSITSLEAFRDLGVTRLSAKIFNIKNAGFVVQDKWETSKNRFGALTSYKRYYLKESMND